MAAGGRRLPRSFYAGDPRDVAPLLLNKVLAMGKLRARIIEVEAYLGEGEDPGSHAHRGRTARNATMFGPPGRLYVYFTYGMHWCANAVCSPDGSGGAVLLRAAAPEAGVEEMWARRPKARVERDLLSGPAKLCQAFGIEGRHDGSDLVRNAGTPEAVVTILDSGFSPPVSPGTSTRIGLAPGRGDDEPWRWFVQGDPNLSRPG